MENRGQVHDQNGQTLPGLHFLLAAGNGLNVQLREQAFSYDTYLRLEALAENGPQFVVQRIDVALLGANPKPELLRAEPASDVLHFPAYGVYDVRHYSKVTYRNIYPDIDLEFVAYPAAGKTLEYNFILRPGACVSDIRLRYSGVAGAELADNRLVLPLAVGTLSEAVPASYWADDRSAVDVQYVIQADGPEGVIVGFRAPHDEIGRALIIDPIPSLDWSTFFGGSANESCRDLSMDAAGNVYLGGSTASPNAIATAGVHQTVIAGLSDAFIAKFDNDGNRLWSTYFGGPTDDFGQHITLDGQENVLLTGTTNSQTGIATAAAAQATFGGGVGDGFVAKFTNDGQLLWATYLGGTGDEFSNGLTADGAGNVFIAGWTDSANGIATAGAHQMGFAGIQDVFVAKYNTSGQLQWSTYFGGAARDIGLQVEADISGDILLSGWTVSQTGIATTGVHQEMYGGGQADAYLARFSTDGILQWGTYYGGPREEYGDALRLDQQGNIFLAGPANSDAGIATAGTHQAVHAGGYDGFLVKFDAAGQRQWGTYCGGNQDESAYGIAQDASGNLFLTGYTNSGNGIATAEAPQTNFAGGNWDAFLVKFSATGQREWGTYHGGLLDNQSFAVEVDAAGRAFIAGLTASDPEMATPGAYQEVFGGGDADVLLARFSPCSEPVLDVPNGGYLCTNQPFVLELHLAAAGPYTFTYTLDGVEQAPVTTTDTVFFLTVDASEYQDSVVITEVRSEECIGTITGLPYIRVVEPLSASEPVFNCDEVSSTYTVSFTMLGGMFGYIPVDPNAGFINGDQFTSRPINFGTDYFFQITTSLACDTITVMGSADCSDPCLTFTPIAAANGPVCAGDSILLSANGADSYLWSGPAGFSSTDASPVIANVGQAYTGNYQVIAANLAGCTDTLLVNVAVNALPVFNQVDKTPLSCENAITTVTIDASGQGTLLYAIDNEPFGAANVFPDLTPGNYDLFARDENGCTGRYRLTITPETGPVITSLAATPPDCGVDNGSISIIARSDHMPLEYSIDGGSSFQDTATFTGLTGGFYDIVVRDTMGCSITAMVVMVGSEEPPVIDEIVIEQAACAADQNSLSVRAVSNSSRLQYSINGVDFQDNNRFTGLLPGVYAVTVQDDGGCSVTELITIPAINALQINEVEVAPVDCRGNGGRITINAQGGTGPLTYRLNDTLLQLSPVFTGLLPGNYRVAVTDGSGCHLEREVFIIRGECPIYLANAFSPNGDGINDDFAVFAASGVNGNVVSYQIYSRWGALVFQSGGFPLGSEGQWWDGTFRGQPAASGPYVYRLEIQLESGERILEKGEVNLLR